MNKSVEITRRLIDAESADYLLFKHQEVSKNGNRQYAHGFRDARKIISEQPTIEAVPVVHGRWIMRGGRFRCSECDTKALWRDTGGTGGFSNEFEQAKTCICPSCGARMDGEEAQQ